MKSIVCTDRELLQSLKNLCTEKNCFRNAKPDETVLNYYNDTMKMAEEELKRDSSPDTENVATIISNILIVIENAAVYFNDTSKDHRKEAIIFEVTEVNSTRVCRFLDESIKMTSRYRATNSKRRNVNRVSTVKHHKSVCILKRTLLLLLTIGFLIFLSGYFVAVKTSQPKSRSFFTGIAQWYKHVIRREAVSFAEKWIRFSKKTGIATVVIGIIWTFQAIGMRILQVLSQKKHKRIQQEWNDYQNLCQAFETVAGQMNKLEW